MTLYPNLSIFWARKLLSSFSFLVEIIQKNTHIYRRKYDNCFSKLMDKTRKMQNIYFEKRSVAGTIQGLQFIYSLFRGRCAKAKEIEPTSARINSIKQSFANPQGTSIWPVAFTNVCKRHKTIFQSIQFSRFLTYKLQIINYQNTLVDTFYIFWKSGIDFSFFYVYFPNFYSNFAQLLTSFSTTVGFFLQIFELSSPREWMHFLLVRRSTHVIS